MGNKPGRVFWATVDRISNQGNGVVETDGGHFILGPVKSEAVSKTVRVRMVGPGQAELVDPDLRKDAYAQPSEGNDTSLAIGDVVKGRLRRRDSEGTPVLEQGGIRVRVPDGQLGDDVEVELVEFTGSSPQWTTAVGKRVDSDSSEDPDNAILGDIELYENLPEIHSDIIQCPAPGCDYTKTRSSVAGHVSGKKDEKHDWARLGYTGAIAFKNESTDRNTGPTGRTDVLHLSDSHLGAYFGGDGDYTITDGCYAGFRAAINVAIELSVDAVLNTGDLFHNDKFGIPSEVQKSAREELHRLAKAGIPFYTIDGNHERQEGRALLDVFEEEGLITRLSNTGVPVGSGIELYGRDFRTAKEWTQQSWSPNPSGTGRYGILGIHQSIAPLSSHEWSECTTSEVASMAGPQIHVVAAGHLHDTKIRWESGDPFVLADSTEPSRAAAQDHPTVGCFIQDDGSLRHRRIKLQLLI